MEESFAAATTGTTQIQVGGFDLLTPLIGLLFGSQGFFAVISGGSLAGLIGFVVLLWNIYTVLAFAVSFLFLSLYIYASIHKNKLEELESERVAADEHAYARKNASLTEPSRFSELQAHIASDNPNDWKLAIIEADIILDEELKRAGYAGTSLGERLRSIAPSSLTSLDDAWQAHKVRNQIAHAGADFVLTHKLANDTIVKYERVFKELEII